MPASKGKLYFIRAIRQLYPKISRTGIKKLPEGRRHKLYLVLNRVVFRFSQNSQNSKHLFKQKEYLCWLAAKTKVPVPRVESHVLAKTKYLFHTYNYITGKRLSPAYFRKLTKNTQIKIAEIIGNFLSVAHSFPRAKAQGLEIRERNPLKNLKWYYKKTQQLILGKLSQKEKFWLDSLFKNFIAIVRLCPPRLGITRIDLKPEHILVDENKIRLCGILDCAEIEFGDRAFDFQFLNDYGEDFLAVVLKKYKKSTDKYFITRSKLYRHLYLVRLLLYRIKKEHGYESKVILKRLRLYIKNHSDILYPDGSLNMAKI